MTDDSLEHEHGRSVLRFRRELAHPPEKVWRALTESSELRHWFPATIEGAREAGAALQFVFPGSPGPAQAGEMRVYEPPRLLEYSWANEVLRWELVPRAGGCTLLFTHIIEDRSTAPRSAAGWDLCIDRMKLRLDTRPGTPEPSWPTRYARFLASFGLGEFPRFMRDTRAEPVLNATRGLNAHVFHAAQSQVSLFTANDHAPILPHRYDQEAYLLVIEGALHLELAGSQLRLGPGHEFHFPPGLPIAGRVERGTRGIFALAAPKLHV